MQPLEHLEGGFQGVDAPGDGPQFPLVLIDLEEGRIVIDLADHPLELPGLVVAGHRVGNEEHDLHPVLDNDLLETGLGAEVTDLHHVQEVFHGLRNPKVCPWRFMHETELYV